VVIALFDVDGTLVNSADPILTAMNAALLDNALPLMSQDDLSRVVGPPIHQGLQSVMRSWGENVDLVPKLVTDFREVYQPLSLELAATYQGVAEMLVDVSRVARLGVVTSKPAAYARPILERLGFAEYFEVIEGPDVSTEVEPKATTLQRGLAAMSVEPSEGKILMIGDRRHDVEAGRVCNVQTVGVTWGFGSRDELESAGADAVIDRPDQLLALIPDRP
jgi:phosphoglycolate phosphatase